VALAYLAIGSVLKALLTRREIGQAILDDVNYDAVAAEALRRSIAAQAFLSPVQGPQHPPQLLRKSA
jgi:hypothetical protein